MSSSGQKSGGEKRKAKSQQEKKSDKKCAKEQHELHVEFEGLLRTITARTSLWKHEALAYLRNFVWTVISHSDLFPAVMGDTPEDLSGNRGGDEIKTPTVGFIADFAGGKSLLDLPDKPILFVLSRKTGFHDVLKQENEPKDAHQRVKLTHLTLLDGDNNQIHTRMATHLADAGRGLKEGDVIQLEMFSGMTYHVNDKSDPMPALLVVSFTRVGQMPTPLKDEIKPIIPYNLSELEREQWVKESKSTNRIDPLTQPPPRCTFENRLCRKFGVNFIGRCICDEIPVGERKLEIIAEDCHLIHKPYSEFREDEMRPRRLMLYWWYATNIYSITGKGNRGKLPDCLEYAIKAAYPETNSEDWTGYIPGKKKKR